LGTRPALRQFVERLLVTYDWGEAFVALNLVLKPMIDDLLLKHTSDLALDHNDHLLGQIFYSLNEDCQWHRQWSQALIQTAIEDTLSNLAVAQTWIDKWYPGALRAVDAFASFFEGEPGSPGTPAFHDLTSQIAGFSTGYLRGMGLQSASHLL
jgi:toluene monooxygenase system protein E